MTPRQCDIRTCPLPATHSYMNAAGEWIDVCDRHALADWREVEE